MLRDVDAAQALADLTEISSQVVDVAIVDADGALLASTIADEARAAGFVEGVQALVADAEALRGSRGLASLSQLEVATLEGSIFVVLGERLIAAATRPDPTVGLVFYDLKHCLRSLDPASTAPAGRSRSRSRTAPAETEAAPAERPKRTRKAADASA